MAIKQVRTARLVDAEEWSSSLVARVLLVAANLVPLVGVLFWDWDVLGVLILYWSENIVLGIYTIVKMVHKAPLRGVFSSLFFLVHFGGFCGVHGLLILSFGGDGAFDPVDGDPWPLFLVFAQMLFNVVGHVVSMAPRAWMIGFAAVFVSHGASLILNYFGRREYVDETVDSLMMAPYRRMFALHVAIIAGGFGVIALGSQLPLLLVLVVLKAGIDLHFHLKEHRRETETDEANTRRWWTVVTGAPQ